MSSVSCRGRRTVGHGIRPWRRRPPHVRERLTCSLLRAPTLLPAQFECFDLPNFCGDGGEHRLKMLWGTMAGRAYMEMQSAGHDDKLSAAIEQSVALHVRPETELKSKKIPKTARAASRRESRNMLRVRLRPTSLNTRPLPLKQHKPRSRISYANSIKMKMEMEMKMKPWLCSYSSTIDRSCGLMKICSTSKCWQH